jgi:ankyrin repeat protein
MELGAKPDPVDLNGQTPIYYAIKFGKFEMVEYLI